MVLYVFALDGSLVYGPDIRDAFPQELVERVLTLHPGAAYVHQGEAVQPPVIPVWEGGQVVGIEPDPDWTPPEPAQDPLAALKGDVARLEETVKKTIPVSPHDKRFLAQKEIGKTIIAWIKANPTCTPQEVEDRVMAQVLAELPGQPVVPKLYWEWTDPATGQTSPQGLAMSYCYEAVVRGYLPPEAPVTWPTLVQLIVATPEEQIAAWLRSL